MTWDEKSVQRARQHLRSADPVIGQIMKRVGPFALKVQRNRFQTLVRSIISQQISTAAARTIHQRLVDTAAPAKIDPISICQLGNDELRQAGLSGQKATYVLDLAAKAKDGTIRFAKHRSMSDDQIVAELIQVKGIGEWTAQMFLMFSLGRPDILPGDDLGIRQAIRAAYNLSELPNRKRCLELGQPWRPFASMASWYLWRSLE
jgi:DNA-3-methyladenine glycosylase II